ncbi:hypothetical protein HZS56_17425 [Streptomyces sp. A108]|nr:hypothetical protein [Streptomyces sp. A108]
MVRHAADLHIRRELRLLHFEPQLPAGARVLRLVQLAPQLLQRLAQ